MSFNEGVTRILVGDKCVGYTALFIRNTRNVKFADTCFMIFRENFNDVQKIVLVLTHNEDLIVDM